MTPTPATEPVGLRAVGVLSPMAAAVRRSAASVGDLGRDVDGTLRWAAVVGREIASDPSVGAVWEALAVTAHLDVAAARILEPHVDALRILAEAAHDDALTEAVDVPDAATWGVFAAEGPGTRLTARRVDDRWRLEGTKPWCSLAGRLSHALVTAWVDEERRGLFAVSLRAPGVTAHTGPWHSRGFPDIVSAPVDFADVPATAIGAPGWYLRRPGFARGGIGVAACWWGGASALLAPLRTAAETERADQLAYVHLGRADAALWAARAVLAEAADLIDARAAVDESLLAARVRAIVSAAAQQALDETDDALGPLPLVADAAHARRTADLRIYLRQQHCARDLAGVGRRIVSTPGGH